MPTTIKLKNSVTTTNAPSSLAQGEVAINITDKKVWVGNAAGTPIQLLGAGGSASFGALTCTSLTNSGLTSGRVTYATTAGLLTDSANMTFNGTNLYLSSPAGFGATSPSYPVEVLADANAIGVSLRGRSADNLSLYNFTSNNGATQYGYILGSLAELRLAQNGANYITAYTNGSERMRIASNGDVGIGANPASYSAGLTVLSANTFSTILAQCSVTTGATGIFARNDANTADCFMYAFNSASGSLNAAVGTSKAQPLTLLTNNTEKMRITSSGDVGIGTSSPATKLDVRGNALFGANGRILLTESSGDAIIGGAAGTNFTDMYVNGALNTRFNLSGSLVLKGGATGATGTGIAFPATQSASSDPNTLDDYEEGTWTPTINMGTGTSTGSSGEGTYVKIGRQVTVTVFLNVGTISAGGKINTINGLPFTVRTGNDQAVGLLRENANTGFGWEGRASSGGTNILLRKVSDNDDSITTGMNFIGTVTYFV